MTGESETQAETMPGSEGVANLDSNLIELTAKFITKSGGGLSPELSANLALEIVLNEIVEQACLATGATGAAIVLRTDGVPNATPHWSPKGDWITWETDQGFMLVSPDGKEDRVLSHDQARTGPSIEVN